MRGFSSCFNDLEGDIGVCGIAVLDNFSCGILVILILNCGIAVLRYSPYLRDAVFWHFGRDKKFSSSPPTFSKPFPVSDRLISC